MTAENVALTVVELLLMALGNVVDYAKVIDNCRGAFAALSWGALGECCPDKVLVTRTHQAIDQLMATKKVPVGKTLSGEKGSKQRPATPEALD